MTLSQTDTKKAIACGRNLYPKAREVAARAVDDRVIVLVRRTGLVHVLTYRHLGDDC
ncbi:MAG: hypothetical protein M3R23_01280 [Actinomycetota bacterium]|nr:hypothetical protein [Actinomycetota bacterium]